MTILIIVTSIAIALLSRMGERPEGDTNAALPGAPPATLPEPGAASDRPAVPDRTSGH